MSREAVLAGEPHSGGERQNHEDAEGGQGERTDPKEDWMHWVRRGG